MYNFERCLIQSKKGRELVKKKISKCEIFINIFIKNNLYHNTTIYTTNKKSTLHMKKVNFCSKKRKLLKRKNKTNPENKISEKSGNNYLRLRLFYLIKLLYAIHIFTRLYEFNFECFKKLVCIKNIFKCSLKFSSINVVFGKKQKRRARNLDKSHMIEVYLSSLK